MIFFVFCIGVKFTLLFRKIINSFMNSHGNYGHNSDQPQNINHKLATLLALIVSFQQKIEVLRTKISGNPNFSPQLYYKQLDRTQKGYISSEDLVTFIKKSKPQFNIDIRYLNQMITKLNKDSKVPKDRLTYFGYLNIIKPYFDTNLAKDLLLRDNMGGAKDASTLCLVVKKIFEDLICTMYVCVAEHQRIKENVIMGDIEYGGRDPGHLFNIYEILQIIQQNSQPTQITSMQQLVQPETHANQPSSTAQSPHRPPVTGTAILSNNLLQTSGLTISNTKQGTLDMFYNFIMKNSQFQIQRSDMKYLLAYLMCHEFMLTHEKNLTTLFMPVAATVEITHLPNSAHRNQLKNYYSQEVSGGSQQINFLGYVHPNSLKQQDMKTLMKNRGIGNNDRIARPRANINKIRKPPVQEQQQQLIDQQPRILIHAPQNNLQTPILQKFMRESKILKNMSRHRMEKIPEQQDSNQSAFIQQSRHKNSPFLRPQQQHENADIEIGKQHHQKPINKDFNLQQVLNNSNLQRSQYYHNLSMRAYIKDQPLQPEEISSRSHLQGLDGSGILNNFMLK